MSWSPNPIFSQSSAAQGFSVRNESGPASTRQPSTRSVTSTPPRRGLDSNRTYSMGGPALNQAASDAIRNEHASQARAGFEQNILDGRPGLALFFDGVRGR